jgi:cellobiose phosphorylase
MTQQAPSSFATPLESDLGLRRVANEAGVAISLLPNGAIFAIEAKTEGRPIMINELLGSPLQGGIGRLILRVGGAEPRNIELVGPAAKNKVGIGADRIQWAGEAAPIKYEVTLWLDPHQRIWLWQVEIASDHPLPCDILFIQDIGLGERPFLMANLAFASQYVDHHIEHHPELGPIVMCRQNLEQGGPRHPWAAHGCLDGAASFATDGLQLFGPGFREAPCLALPFGAALPGERLQHEAACVVLQSREVTLEKGEAKRFTFFGVYDADHREPSGPSDLGVVDAVRRARDDFRRAEVELEEPVRGIPQDAPPAVARSLSDADLERLYPERRHDERRDGRLLSFFVPDGRQNRHVVLRDKELLVERRHGTLLRSGQALLVDEKSLSVTVWMHGVFAAQLTIGNTTFHKLFSVAPEPYNIARTSGLRILIELDGSWRLLTIPSVFEMGLNDTSWIYHLDGRVVRVRAIASGEHAAMQWRIEVTGEPCRFLVFGHLTMGERELENAGRIEIDRERKRISLRPDPASLWGTHCPNAVHHLVTSTPDMLESMGGDELLYADGKARGGGFVALRTRATSAFAFSVVGSTSEPAEAEGLAELYERDVEPDAMLIPARRFWSWLTRDVRLRSSGPGTANAALAELETILPWFAHNAMMHLSVPRGLEQYIGAAWGTRDVCQGPVELLLSLGHDTTVKDILRLVFARQFRERGDFPGWFMLEPYAEIGGIGAPGDVLIWPMKALCDYVEATDDVAVLDEEIAWRREQDSRPTEERAPIAAHIDKLIATLKEHFIPGTHLVRYGDGDWNDSLQPVDLSLRDKMVSSWTVVLLFEQLNRYAAVLRRAGRDPAAAELASLAAAISADFDRHLVRDGVVAGYAIFEAGRDAPELLLHPSDRRTGVKYSLLPMERGIISGLFTSDQARRHVRVIREHLLFPDGARLMDAPIAYRGGKETIFHRAESSPFFGREIGLMYMHEHLRYGEAMALLGEADALWDALALANPISVTERLPHASLRQRNAYFSSSDAAFKDRYEASARWDEVKRGDVAVDGGWRIYSSGPGLFTRLLLQKALGVGHSFGRSHTSPVLPATFGKLELELTVDGERRSFELKT